MQQQLTLKNYVFLITYSAAILFIILNSNYILNILNKIKIVFMPFVYGFIIAYIINWPYQFFKKRLFTVLESAKRKNIIKSKRCVKSNTRENNIINLVAIVLSYSIFLGALIFIFISIIPQLFANIDQFTNNFSRYSNSFIEWLTNIENKFKLDFQIDKYYNYIETFSKGISGFLEKFVQNLFPSVFSLTKNFAVGIYNWIIGLVISIYLIGSKEKLINQLRILAYTYIPQKFTGKVFRIINLTHENFGKFLAGKFIDSIIIGILCFIGVSILKIPYALLISVIVGITNIIPFFGPFMGAIPCIIMLLIIDHIKAVWFTIFIFVLQQIDANIIGPKVLGNTVGISGMWIMFSVIVGGGLFGVTGMILGVPVFAVIYTIISEHIYSYRANK